MRQTPFILLKYLFITSAIVLLAIGLLFFVAINYLHVGIENDGKEKVVISSVTLGGLPIKITEVALEVKERIGMSAFKFSQSPVLNVRLSSGAGNKRNASCVLDAAGSDSCNIFILHDGTLDCSCYK